MMCPTCCGTGTVAVVCAGADGRVARWWLACRCEDAIDAEVARMALADIKRDPAALVTGAALAARLAEWSVDR